MGMWPSRKQTLPVMIQAGDWEAVPATTNAAAPNNDWRVSEAPAVAFTTVDLTRFAPGTHPDVLAAVVDGLHIQGRAGKHTNVPARVVFAVGFLALLIVTEVWLAGVEMPSVLARTFAHAIVPILAIGVAWGWLSNWEDSRYLARLNLPVTLGGVAAEALVAAGNTPRNGVEHLAMEVHHAIRGTRHDLPGAYQLQALVGTALRAEQTGSSEGSIRAELDDFRRSVSQ